MDAATKADYEDMKRLKRKDRIKNIMIAFLVLMMVLTLFSNTIMNYTLPEVSVMKMAPGVISRSTDVHVTVEAVQDYTLLAEEAVEIKRVAVKKGQSVTAGQTLFYLNTGEESSEVKDLRATIESAKIQYEKDLLEAGTDYFTENQQIQMARDALNAAIAARDQALANLEPETEQGTLSAAELLARQYVLDRDKSALDSELYASLSADSKAQLQPELDRYLNADAKCRELTQSLSQLESGFSGDSTITSSERDLAELQLKLKRLKEDQADSREIEDAQIAVDYAAADLAKLKEQKQNIETQRVALNTANADKTLALSALSPKLMDLSSKIEAELMTLKRDVPVSDKEMLSKTDTEKGGSKDYDSAVNEAQYALETAIHNLEVKMKSDKIEIKKKTLDLNAAKKEIEKQEEELTKLLEKEGASEIVSPVDGVVAEITGFAGARVETDGELIKLTLLENGFQAVTPLSNDVAGTLLVGQKAKIADNNEIEAVIQSITKSKTQKNVSDITLEFRGNIEVGQQVDVLLSEYSVQSDHVIPKSAVKEDASGKFVYGVIARNTPIGNRYEAEKIPVSVLAEDDAKCSVSGEFGDAVDYIIVASSAPFSSGDKVKLAEE